MGKERTKFEACLKALGHAITDLAVSLDKSQLESMAIEAILEHRRLLAIAERAYDELNLNVTWEADDINVRRSVYFRAMLNSKAQMAVVAMLVDQLGFVPDAP